MAELLFKVREYTHADPVKDRQGVHKKGDFINVKPDGWSDGEHWHQSKYADTGIFVVVKVPGFTPTQEQIDTYRGAWKDDFGYEVLQSNAGQGRYTVRVYEQNAGASGENNLTATKVEGFLTRWGCADISFTTNSCTFDLSLWNAVRSAGFWEIRLIGTIVNFTLVSYSSTTGVGKIQVDNVSIPADRFQIEAEDRITQRGGTVVSSTESQVVFDIERSVVLDAFRADMKDKAEQVYKRHRFCIDASEVDTILSQGGMVTITQQQLVDRLRDKMA